ncbi:MAG: transposase family protein [Cyanobacteria bacterium P01_D01_bin.116]
MKTPANRQKLEDAWTKGPSAYGSVANLSKATGYDIKTVKDFLHSKDSYTKYYLHKYKTFPRLKSYARDINEIWCIDVAYVDKLASYNDGYKYLLVCVDVISRFVRVSPMKSLTAKSAQIALTNMLTDSPSYPKKLWSDRGREFQGQFKAFCNNIGVEIYHTDSGTKAAFAERAIRSLKAIISKYMEEKSTWNYIDQLQTFVDIMNNRVNRSIGKPPSKVVKNDVMSILHKPSSKFKKPKFKVGDKVRIAGIAKPFRKGYFQQFSDEVFTIVKIFSRLPPSYIIRDEKENLDGKFYEPELIKVI